MTTDTLLGSARELGLAPERLVEEGLAALALELTGARALHKDAVRQAAHRLVAEREIATLLAALADVELAPWKGLAVEWPRPIRPVGDLDLIVRSADLPRAVRMLEALGYRRAPEPRAGLLRRGPTGAELLPPPGRVVAVDLHARPFRSIGHRISADELLDRARPGKLAGVPTLLLRPVDHLHVVLVHAAKHALASPKWLLDLVVLTVRCTDADWQELHALSRRARTERPVALALSAIGRPDRVPLRYRSVLERLVTRARAGSALSRGDKYVLEWTLEPSIGARLRMLLGLLER